MNASLKKSMKKYRIRQVEIAERLGLAQSVVSRFLAGCAVSKENGARIKEEVKARVAAMQDAERAARK